MNRPKSALSLHEFSTSLLEMVKKRESFKKRLRELYPNSNFYLYSESTSIKNLLANFSQNTKIKIEQRSVNNVHLIVFVHGLEGKKFNYKKDTYLEFYYAIFALIEKKFFTGDKKFFSINILFKMLLKTLFKFFSRKNLSSTFSGFTNSFIFRH